MKARAVRSCADILKIDVEDESSYVVLRKVNIGLDAKAAMADLLASSDVRNANPDEVDKVCATAKVFNKEVVVQIKKPLFFRLGHFCLLRTT